MTTPMTLAKFKLLQDADPNAWWRLESGEMEVLFDEAVELAEQQQALFEQRIAQLEQRLDISVRRLNNMADRLTALETMRIEERLATPDDNS